MKYDAEAIITLNKSLSNFTRFNAEWIQTTDGETIDTYYDVNPYQEEIRRCARRQIERFEKDFFQENPHPPAEDDRRGMNICDLYSSRGIHQFLFGSGDLGIPVIECSDNRYDGDYAYLAERHIMRHMKKEGERTSYKETSSRGYFAQSYTDDTACAIILKRLDSRENEIQIVFFEKDVLEKIAQKTGFDAPSPRRKAAKTR